MKICHRSRIQNQRNQSIAISCLTSQNIAFNDYVYQSTSFMPTEVIVREKKSSSPLFCDHHLFDQTSRRVSFSMLIIHQPPT